MAVFNSIDSRVPTKSIINIYWITLLADVYKFNVFFFSFVLVQNLNKEVCVCEWIVCNFTGFTVWYSLVLYIIELDLILRHLAIVMDKMHKSHWLDWLMVPCAKVLYNFAHMFEKKTTTSTISINSHVNQMLLVTQCWIYYIHRGILI